jgi:hypothetical protein
MFQQNVLLEKSVDYKPDSPFLAVGGSLGKYVHLRVWLIYPLMTIQELPSTVYSFTKVAEMALTNITKVTTSDKQLQYRPVEYNITMVPPLVCCKIKYNFVRNIIIGDYPLSNAPTFNGRMADDVLDMLHEHNFDDITKALMDYYYATPLNGLRFIVH